MKRMIITGIRRLLFGGQPAQQAMGAGSNDPLTGDKRTVESAQLAFPSGTDGRSSGKKRLFFRQRTAVLSAQDARSLGKEQQFPREEIFVPSGGNNIFLGRKLFFPRLDMSFSFPHFALRFLLVIAMILGGVLESGAVEVQTITNIDELKSVLGAQATKIDAYTIQLTGDVSISSNLMITAGTMTLDLGDHTITYDRSNVKEEPSNHVAIEVNGSSANVTVKNGTIVVKAAKGIDYQHIIWPPETISSTSGSNAFAVVLNDGKVSMLNLNLSVTPGTGGKISEVLGFKPNGEAWVVDAINDGSKDKTYTLGDMLPYGAYFSTPSNVDYTSTGGGIKAQEAVVAYSTYTTKFIPNNGDNIIEAKYTIENTSPFIQQLAKQPTWQGYTFKEWTKTHDGDDKTKIVEVNGVPVLDNRAAEGTITYTAQWDLNVFNVSFLGIEGASNNNKFSTYNINDGKVLLEKASKRYYNFLYWTDDENKEVTSITYNNVEKYLDTKNYKLTAHWEPIPYTIKFTVTDESIADITYNIESSDKVLPQPQSRESEGYDFDGWYNGDTKVEEIPVSSPSDMTLEAKWVPHKYTITYYNQEGTQTLAHTPTTFDVLTPVTLTLYQTKRDGYLFKAWMSGANGEGEVVTSISGVTNQTVYACWEPINYSLTYKLNGGTYSGNTEISYTIDNAPLLLTSDNVSRTGYTFDGWYQNEEKYTGRAPLNGGVSGTDTNGKPTMRFELTAKWNRNEYDLTFDENGGSAVDDATYNIDSEITQMPQTSRTGYTFLGWYATINGEEKKFESISKADYGNLVLKAKWELIQYEITYIGAELANTSFDYETNITLTVPTKENYSFGGWYRDENYSGEAVETIAASTLAESIKVYAKWIPNTYKLTFDANGGNISQTTQSYTYGEVAEFAKRPYLAHYDFLGWYYDQEGTEPYGERIEVENSGNHTLYAKWKPTDYTISYDLYYGDFPEGTDVPTTYNIETSVQSLPTPVREGYTFGLWFRDDLLKDTLDLTKEAISVGNYGNKTFYATWSRGFSVILSQPKEGVISVKQGDQVIASGTPLAKGTELTISAVPTTSGYVLKQLVINGQAFTTSPQTVTMGEANLIISAEFVASTKPTVSAPTITTDPDREKVDAETLVKVTLAKTDAASTLYYALNDQQASPYSAPFVVDGGVGDTVTIRAIARREGYNDGITTRRIVFDGRLHLTLDLPAGVTATAPDGGAVVDAIVKGGTFEFKLQVDKNYFASTDSLQVMANDSLIKPGSSGVYRLYDQKGDVKVVVKGLKAYTCVVTLLQTEHGQIAFAEGEEESSRTIAYGTELTLQATADEDYKFSKWSTGSQQNPLKLTVVSDTTLSATFVHDYKAYQITLPEVEGVTAKPFTGYSTEVKRDGTFKFYLVIANGYHEEQLVVRADGEELVKNKGGYALYHITKNIRISVEGIARDAFALTLPPNVQAWKLATMEEAAKASLYAETTLLLQAMAPEGQRFLKWTDGSTENPRTATALDAKQLYPLFTTLSEIPTAKVSLEQTAGAGITGATSNLDVANLGDQLSVKVVVLPAYSQSEVRLLANGQSVEPQARLRAASEAKSYYYQVPVAQADVKLKVEGLRLNQYQLTVAESTGGRVEGVPSGKVTHGDTVSLTAKAAEGMTFVRWWDGNTLNPYPYPVTGDQTIRAYFVGESSPVDNESVTAEEVRVCSPTTGGLWVELPVPQDIWLWDSSGRLLLHRFDSGTVRLAVPAGIYLLQCGMRPVCKVVVRQ